MEPSVGSDLAEFLVGLMFLSLAVSCGMLPSHWMRWPEEKPALSELRLDPYQVALLVSRTAAVEAAVTALLGRGALRFDAQRRALTVGDALPAEAHRLEQVIHDSVRHSPAAPDRQSLLTAALPHLVSLEEALSQQGLLVTREWRHWGWFFSFLTYAGVMGLWLWAGNGLQPVPLLLTLLGALVLGGVLRWHPMLRRSRRGDAALALLRRENLPLRTSMASEGARQLLSPSALALAVGLFGATALASSDFADVYDSLHLDRQSQQGSSSSCGGGGCGSSGGDGGSSGGGGGCGGGCGGCGGE
jgi:uncharacterized protein (TIGR04222 family)